MTATFGVVSPRCSQRRSEGQYLLIHTSNHAWWRNRRLEAPNRLRACRPTRRARFLTERTPVFGFGVCVVAVRHHSRKEKIGTCLSRNVLASAAPHLSWHKHARLVIQNPMV